MMVTAFEHARFAYVDHEAMRPKTRPAQPSHLRQFIERRPDELPDLVFRHLEDPKEESAPNYRTARGHTGRSIQRGLSLAAPGGDGERDSGRGKLAARPAKLSCPSYRSSTDRRTARGTLRSGAARRPPPSASCRS